MRIKPLKFHIPDIANGNNLSRASVVCVFLFYIVGVKPLSAQNVGINATSALPKASAILDLSTGNSGTLGFLPPKVALTATNAAGPITKPSNGLLVYDTVSAGTVPNNVTEGFYYWNGTSWIRIEDNNATQQYGYNTQSVIGTTDQKTNSGTYSAVPQMSITFTPVHSVVFLTFTASGITDLSENVLQSIQFEVLKNGSPAATTGYGCTSIAQILTSPTTLVPFSGWNCDIIMPISVTAGTSVTISIDWLTSGPTTPVSYILNNVSSSPTTSHRVMFIND